MTTELKSNADNAQKFTINKLQDLFDFAADSLPDEALLDFSDTWQAEEKAAYLGASIEALAWPFSSDDKSSLPANDDIALALWALKEQASDISALLNISTQASDILDKRRKTDA